MTEAIIVALIAAGGSIVGQIILSNKDKKERIADEARKEQALNDRLKTIEDKQDIHNGYAEKFGDISTAISAIQQDIVAMKKDIEWLREAGR